MQNEEKKASLSFPEIFKAAMVWLTGKESGGLGGSQANFWKAICIGVHSPAS